jgi:hypothetical protein
MVFQQTRKFTQLGEILMNSVRGQRASAREECCGGDSFSVAN